MKKRVIGLHGTHQTAFNRILRKGFEGAEGNAVWSCSDGFNYFWDPTRFESWGEEDRPFREAFDEAMGSAYIAAPFAAPGEYRRVVMLVDLTGLAVEPDTSCENMDNAIRIPGHIPATRILCAWLDGIDLSAFRLHIVAENMERDLYRSPPLSPVESEFLRLNADCFQNASLGSVLMDFEGDITITYSRPNMPAWAMPYLKFPNESIIMKAAA